MIQYIIRPRIPVSSVENLFNLSFVKRTDLTWLDRGQGRDINYRDNVNIHCTLCRGIRLVAQSYLATVRQCELFFVSKKKPIHESRYQPEFSHSIHTSLEATAAMDPNQARRDADLVSRPVRGTGGTSSPVPAETFKYSALQQDQDCTRLVRIEPAEKDDDPISCTIVNIAFGDRPEYQALSYMWATRPTK